MPPTHVIIHLEYNAYVYLFADGSVNSLWPCE